MRSPIHSVTRRLASVGIAIACSIATLEGSDAPGGKIRDVLASAYLHPFLTDADMRAYFTDTRGRVSTAGGVVTFCYPGVEGVRLRGTTLPIARTGPNLVQVEMSAGTHDVDIVASPGKAMPDLPTGFAPNASAVSTQERFKTRAAALEPGDELVIKNGVYVGWQVEIAVKGTRGRPIVIRAETPGGVVFSHRVRITIRGDHLILKGCRFENTSNGSVRIDGGSHNRITQCQFFYCGNPLSTFGHVATMGTGSHRNRVDHCYFTGSRSMSLGQGVRPGPNAGTHNRLDHNIFRDVYRYWVNGQENIQIGQGQTSSQKIHAIAEYNLFDHAWGDSEIFSNKTSCNTYRWNVAAHCPLASMYLRGGDEARVDGNVMINCAYGLTVYGRRHMIVNNLIVDQEGYGIRLGTGSRDGKMTIATEGSLVAHNTILNCAAGAIYSGQTSERSPYAPKNNRILNNLIVGGEGTLMPATGFVESDVRGNLLWTTGRAETGGAGRAPVRLDPRLTGTGVGVGPSADSPAVDKALPLKEVAHDRWNRRRPIGGGPDIGADEISGESPARLPLPEIPPRPILAPDLYKDGAMLAYNEDMPVRGWTTKGNVKAAYGQVTLTDSSMALAKGAPQGFVMEWEYRPHEYVSTATLTFALGHEDRGYSLTWGGAAKDDKPTGIVTLRKGDTVIAQGADIVQYYANYRFKYNRVRNKNPKPGPRTWYRFTLVKSGARVWLGLNHPNRMTWPPVPIFAWEDRGLLAGPALSGPRLRIEQQGAGTWRNMGIWTYGYTGDVPPDTPAPLSATAKGPRCIRLRWPSPAGRRITYDVHRSTDADFVASDGNRIAVNVTGRGFDDFNVLPGRAYTYRVQAFNALRLASGYAAAAATTPRTGPQYVLVKAGTAKNVEAPLTVSQDRTSGDAFLWSTSGRYTSGPPEKGLAAYSFHVSSKAKYAFWARVIAPSAAEDSFYVSLDDGAFRNWGTGIHETWTWTAIGSLRTVALAAGAHTLRLKPRDPGTKLSAILVTDDVSFGDERPQ